jgi:enoyl-CoA hydratase
MAKVSLYMKNNFETIRLETEGDLGILTINRPTKLNALNIQVLSELKVLLSDLVQSSLRGLIVTGEGEKAFIAGADIAEMKPMGTGVAQDFSELGQQVTQLFEALPFPVVAAVNGFALGGGFEMALACDFIFATTNAVFGLPEVKLGLIPGFGGTQRLHRIVGERRAREINYSGRNVSAEEAKNLGIALELFATKEELLQHTRQWFESTLKNSSYAISRVKMTINEGYSMDLETSLKIERREFSNIFQTEDMIEGTAAFLEKRKPNFKGK